MISRRHLAFLLLPVLLLASLDRPAIAADRTLAVVVSRHTAETLGAKHLSKRALRKIYRRQQLLWRNGERIVPLNLRAASPLRAAFTRALFNQSVEQMATFWNEQYFAGVSPPHVVDSQEAVLRFVSRIPGAIGYVATCRVDERVTVLLKLHVDTPKTNLACR